MILLLKSTLIVWLLIGATTQIRFPSTYLLRSVTRAAGLLPGWNFFSPTPITGDVLVDCRGRSELNDVADDTGKSNRQDVWLPVVQPTPRRFSHALICTERRATKVVFDAAVAVAQLHDHEIDLNETMKTHAYVTLLHTSTAVARNEPGRFVEFRIVHVGFDEGGERRTEVFRSPHHERDAQDLVVAGDAELA